MTVVVDAASVDRTLCLVVTRVSVDASSFSYARVSYRRTDCFGWSVTAV